MIINVYEVIPVDFAFRKYTNFEKHIFKTWPTNLFLRVTILKDGYINDSE